ncbi:hypothetical protein GIB64_05525 [Pseudomonas lactis]|uniref:DUF3486 family protein n=1 Tax=Pseudomonas TaxID=286 RepID=UPI001160486E|nr:MULTISPECIES: DUF3486 family protein [Pseudomonas]MBA5956880.1 hypothetical protein [Pseudomonas lactis]
MSLVDRIMASSPEGAYAKRSSEFKVGFRAAFERRIEGKDVGLPYPLGTTQADAFLNGLEVGSFRWYRHFIREPILNCEKTTLKKQPFRKCAVDSLPLDVRIDLNHALDESDFCNLDKRLKELRCAGFQVSESSLRNYAQKLCFDLARARCLSEEVEGVKK